jgi:hypothetical protein
MAQHTVFMKAINAAWHHLLTAYEAAAPVAAHSLVCATL